MANATEIRNQMSQSNFLKGADIGAGKEVQVLISQVEQGEQKQKDGKVTPQLMLHFQGKDKKLGLNVGNLDTMIALFGSETDTWVGKKVNLFTVPTQTPGGQPALGIRIKSSEVQIEVGPNEETIDMSNVPY